MNRYKLVSILVSVAFLAGYFILFLSPVKEHLPLRQFPIRSAYVGITVFLDYVLRRYLNRLAKQRGDPVPYPEYRN